MGPQGFRCCGWAVLDSVVSQRVALSALSPCPPRGQAVVHGAHTPTPHSPETRSMQEGGSWWLWLHQEAVIAPKLQVERLLVSLSSLCT